MADARSEIGAALEGWADPAQVRTLVNEVLAATKQMTVEFSCKTCGQKQRQSGTVSDAVAVARALEILGNQAWGRPDTATPDADRITFVREVHAPPMPLDAA